MAKTSKRDVALAFRMTAEERDMLVFVAEQRGLTQSDVLRQCIRACYDEEHGKRSRRRR
jgi:hypothetical protein